ncbi:ABC transporter permease [bacterium]|nr:ABC transporter permease [bacterium]
MLCLRTVWAFLLKDIEEAVRSHIILFILIGPVLLSVFFSRFFANGDVRHPVVLICDDGRSALVQALRTTDLFQLQEEPQWEKCREAVRSGRACGAVHITASFDADLHADAFPELSLAVNEASLTQAAIFREGIRGALRQMAGQELPADVRVERVNEHSGDAHLAMLPIWLVFTCMGGLVLTSASLTEEMDNKTLAAVLMTPTRLSDVLWGKTLAGFAIALVSSLLVLYLNSDGMGDNLALIVFLVIGSALFSVGGLVFGLLARSQAVANAVGPVLYTVLFVPLALADISERMRFVSHYLPTWYLYDGLSKALLAGLPLSGLMSNIACLAVCAAVLIAVGIFKLRSAQAVS